MTTIVNSPAPQESSSGVSTIVGAIVLLVAVYLFFIYALPAIRGGAQMGSPQINVPSNAKLDVNIQQKK